MVVLGAVLGAITFFIQGSVQWDGSHVATSLVMVALLCAMFFIPAVPGAGYEVRGNGEMFPLNGPAWSLFFEYIGNIFYALFIHKFSTKALTVMVVILGIALTMFACSDAAGYGSIGVGWTLDGVNFVGGLLRMLFPFSMGMLLSRCFKPVEDLEELFWDMFDCVADFVSYSFRRRFRSPILMNGVFEMFCIIFVFPVLVWLGASGSTTDKTSTRICKFLGDISFPLYIIHYPFMYLFYAWLIKNEYLHIG